jgi:hypothetical protein
MLQACNSTDGYMDLDNVPRGSLFTETSIYIVNYEDKYTRDCEMVNERSFNKLN